MAASLCGLLRVAQCAPVPGPLHAARAQVRWEAGRPRSSPRPRRQPCPCMSRLGGRAARPALSLPGPRGSTLLAQRAGRALTGPGGRAGEELPHRQPAHRDRAQRRPGHRPARGRRRGLRLRARVGPGAAGRLQFPRGARPLGLAPRAARAAAPCWSPGRRRTGLWAGGRVSRHVRAAAHCCRGQLAGPAPAPVDCVSGVLGSPPLRAPGRRLC